MGEGNRENTYLSAPSWNCHKAPRRSVALTGETGRAAVSLHIVAAGGPAYAAACRGETRAC